MDQIVSIIVGASSMDETQGGLDGGQGDVRGFQHNIYI
jgi:hypothetical protein